MRTRHVLLGAALVSGVAVAAVAQTVGSSDPNQLPTTQGKVAQYSLTPRGDVDGVILADGTQVHLPPHLGNQLVQAVKPDDMVTIHGVKARNIPVIQAATLRDERTGQTIADNGPPATMPHPSTSNYQAMTAEGRVREPLYGPRGDLNGALLDDGTQIHLPPDRAGAMADTLQAGKQVVAEGYGVAGPYGRALDARRIGASAAQMVAVGPPGPGPGRPPAPPPAPPQGGPGMAPPPPAAPSGNP